MISLQYNAQRSKIIEYLYIPIFLMDELENFEDDFSQKELELLKDAFVTRDRLVKDMTSFKTEVEQYYLLGQFFSLLHALYFFLIEKEEEPEDLDATYEAILALSQDDIAEVFRILLTDEEEVDASLSLFDLLERSTKSPQQKWYWSLAIRNPLETVRRLVALSQKIAAIYTPYYESARQEREEFVEQFDLERLCKESSQLQVTNFQDFGLQEMDLVVFSPWFVLFALFFSEKWPKIGPTLIVSTGIDRLMSLKSNLDLDDLVTALKVISDTTRYQVLVELIKPHAKSKDIADKLGITGAAVSFHTQKLLNSDLLVFNSQQKDTKYVLNRSLFSQMIDKLKSDFDLD